MYVGAPQYTMPIFGFPFLQVLAGIRKNTMQLYFLDMTLLLQLCTFIITIPYVIHKYTLICITSCSSLYLLEFPLF